MHTKWPCCSIRLFMLAVLLVSAWEAGVTANSTPLLQPGKKTIYQRVLTRPGAELVSRPGQTKGEPQPVFSRFYVYARTQNSGNEWIEVGVDARGKTVGWLQADTTVPWKQQIALAFTNPAGRERALFFQTREDLEKVLESDTPGPIVAPLRKTIAAGGRDPKIVSIEPKDYVDINQNFYLLPILDSEDIYTGMGPIARLLKVASVTKRNTQAGVQSGNASPTKASVLRSFKAAVVFVIDSTISMGPYIKRTREAIKDIYREIEKQDLLDKVKFGLIAYRSSVDAVPGLEYVVKKFADPAEVDSGADFISKVSDLRPAKISSKRFDEDPYAGIMLALEDIPWTQFGGRYIVLVTDAGALRGDDPLSKTQLDAEQVRLEAQHRGVAIYALHLKTPEGKRNHASAEQQYSALTVYPPATQALYFDIETGSVNRFGEIVDRLAASLVEHVKGASRGETVAGSATTADPSYPRRQSQDPQLQRLVKNTALISHAMQLAYLGKARGAQVPPVFEGWISDIDFDDPDKHTVQVRVLLTKNQLSDMHMVLKGIVDAANQGVLDPTTFFDSLRSFAAQIGRDPNLATGKQATRLADLGLLDEYLSDLPYKSDVMDIDQDTWSRWGTHRQFAFIKAVTSKMRLYELYNRDADRWISLAPDSPESEHVYPVPLEALP